MADLPLDWTFESTVTDPSGVRVTTVITVPAETASGPRSRNAASWPRWAPARPPPEC
jgi:hypothetical protein